MVTQIQKTEIKNLGSQLIDCSEQLTRQVQRLNQLTDAIQQAWQGEDSIRYQEAIKTKYAVGLQTLANQVKDYGTYLNEIPGAYEALDEAFTQQNVTI